MLNKQIPATCIDAWLAETPASQQPRLRRQRDPQRQASSLLALQLLKRAAQQLQLREFRLQDLAVPQHGKPHWERPLDFNITHSAQLVSCAASVSCRVGIDVERVRDYHAAVAQRVMDEAELQSIERDPEAFFELWTAKEAVAKACGRGIAALRKVHTLGDSAVLDGETWYLMALSLAAGYYGHLATDIQDMPIAVERVSVDALCQAAPGTRPAGGEPAPGKG